MSGQEAFLEPGMMLAGRYSLLSAGVVQDLGTVHQAHDTVDNRAVTVLVLPHGRLSGPEALRRLIEVQERVASLEQPRLVPYVHAGIVAGRSYLVRPVIPQRSLADILAHGPRLESKASVEIALRLCETLAPLHRAGLVHGSLSPYSVLVSQDTPPGARAPEWTVSVVDIGLVPALQSREAPGRLDGGRSPYFWPEQATGSDARASSDVYVVASLLYTMLAGRPPFRGADAALVALQHERQEPPSLGVLVPSISPRLVEVVDKALDKEPANRYRNAGQMAHVLRGHWAELQVGRMVPAQATGRERLLVPAPRPVPVDEGRLPEQEVAGEQVRGAGKEAATANLVTVLLLILALIAVLGLIPLWQTLYRRYATPAALPAPAPEGWLAPEVLAVHSGLGEWYAPAAWAGEILCWGADAASGPARGPLPVTAPGSRLTLATPVGQRSGACLCAPGIGAGGSFLI